MRVNSLWVESTLYRQSVTLRACPTHKRSAPPPQVTQPSQ